MMRVGEERASARCRGCDLASTTSQGEAPSKSNTKPSAKRQDRHHPKTEQPAKDNQRKVAKSKAAEGKKGGIQSFW